MIEPAQYLDYEMAQEIMDPLALEWAKLFAEHWQETERYLGARLAPDQASLLARQEHGNWITFAVRLQSSRELVGYLMFHVGSSMQVQGMKVAFDEGFFLTKKHRKGVLALRLLRYAEQGLRAARVHYMGVSSKWLVGGTKVEKLYKRAGFAPVAVVFTKPLKG